LLGDFGSESLGICEHAAASTHIAVAASSLLGFSVNGLAFPSARAAMVPMLYVGVKEVGDSEGFFFACHRSGTASGNNARRREWYQLATIFL
jgi:hypothetical protein